MTAGTLIYVYGVVPADTVVPDGLTGIFDAPVELVEHEGVAAVVSGIAADRRLGRRADLVAHGRVLDALATARAVVPVRFGSVLPNGSDVTAGLLEPNGERYRELLDELGGKKQFNLRGRYDEGAVLTEVIAENPEIAELRRRTRGLPEEATYYERMRLGELVARALAGKRDADSRVILDELLPHSVTFHLRDGARIDHLIDAAFLVELEKHGAFDRAAESAAAAMRGRATLRLVGPVAPYDFASDV